MIYVCIICPSHRTCRGDPAVSKRSAKIYARYPTAALLSERTKDHRKTKDENKSFFEQIGRNSKQYTVEPRWCFETKHEAIAKLMYEARGAGHYIHTEHGWVIPKC